MTTAERICVALEQIAEALQAKRSSETLHHGPSLFEVEMGSRLRNVASRIGLVSIGDLARCTRSVLIAMKNCGATTCTEAEQVLHKYGLRLGMTDDEVREVLNP